MMEHNTAALGGGGGDSRETEHGTDGDSDGEHLSLKTLRSNTNTSVLQSADKKRHSVGKMIKSFEGLRT